VHSLRITSKFSQGSFRADLRQDNKRDDKVREVIIQGLAQVQAYDGRPAGRFLRSAAARDPELLSRTT
jgi:hypothetical protein